MTEPSAAAPAPPAAPAVRVLRQALAVALALGSLAWAADLYRTVGLIFLPEQLIFAMLGAGLALAFLLYPARRKAERGAPSWYDGALAIVGFATGWYVALVYPELIVRHFETPADGIAASIILYVLCLEGLRRTTGYPLVIIIVVFTIYAFVGHLVPGALQTREVEFNRLVLYLGIDTSALPGLVMLIAITVVIPFLLFGQLLLHSGGSSFFNDFSLALMGRYRGGAAKISVMASSLFGSISGIVVSNILATGVITIPLMKKAGFSSRHAAAVEATASTGGQLMPPVMGAVAFLMADFLQLPYREIVIAALVPSLLYYVALFIQADLTAAKLGIKRVEASQIPELKGVLASGWVFALPFAVLIYALFWLNYAPETAALYASLTVLAIGLLIGYGGQRMTLGQLFQALVATGNASLDILMIGAGAGFIMGILQATGLGFALTLFLVKIGGGNLVALLVIAALMCIVLGMGMPTLGVYVLLAILIAPSLVEVGFAPLPAHMFILYLGMMSFITPPVAIGAFFAASLAGAPPMRTGFLAMRFGWTAFIVPFLFIFSPSLLLQGDSVATTVVAIATAVSGVWLASAAMTGYFTRPMSLATRAGFFVAGLFLLVPHDIAAWTIWSDLAGFALAALLISYEVAGTRRARAVAS